LAPAIEWQASEFQKRTGIRCTLDFDLKETALDPDRSTGVFRILQETLTNVMRHANATQVRVDLKEDAHNLILHVHDNGRGLTEKELSDPKSLGLLGMRERASILGGSITIRGTRGEGTDVRLQIPFNTQKAGGTL